MFNTTFVYRMSQKKCIHTLKEYYTELKTQMYKMIGYLLTRRLQMSKMAASYYNALLDPPINGTANVLNYFNKDIDAGIFNFLLKFF